MLNKSRFLNQTKEAFYPKASFIWFLPDILLLLLLPILALSFSPYFHDNFTVIKWLLLYLLVPVIFMGKIIITKNIDIPFFDKKMAIFFLLVFMFYLGTFFVGSSYNVLPKILDTGTFFLLFFLFYFQKNNRIFNDYFRIMLVGTAFIAASIGFIQTAGHEILPVYSQVVFSTFGNPNMLSEFLGLSLLVLFFIEFKEKSILMKAIYYIVFSTIGTYLFFMRTRSCFLALFFTLIILYKQIPSMKRILILFIICFSLFKSYVFKKNYFDIHTNEQRQKISSNLTLTKNNKENSIYDRLAMWKVTLAMVKDNLFFGIGPYQFEFNFIPYAMTMNTKIPISEEFVFNNPHNEYLRILVEKGMPFFVLSFIFIIMILKKYILEYHPKDYFILAGIIYFSIEAIFQFPLINSYSFVAIIFFIANLMNAYPSQSIKLYFPKKILLISFAGVLFSISILKLVSSYYEGNAKNYDDLKLACKIYPANTEVCLSKASVNIERGQYLEAKETVKSIIKENPFHFPALFLAGKVFFELGDINRSCLYMKRYLRMFYPQKTSLTKLHQARCRPIKY